MSWKTTVMGICTVLGAIAAAAKAILDSDPATNPDWPLVIGAITTGLGLIFARDNNKTSADVGAVTGGGKL